MNQFKALLEKQKQDNAVKLQQEQRPEDEGQKKETRPQEQEDGFDGEFHGEERRRPNDRGHRLIMLIVYFYLTCILIMNRSSTKTSDYLRPGSHTKMSKPLMLRKIIVVNETFDKSTQSYKKYLNFFVLPTL